MVNLSKGDCGVPANCWESLFFEGKEAKDVDVQPRIPGIARI